MAGDSSRPFGLGLVVGETVGIKSAFDRGMELGQLIGHAVIARDVPAIDRTLRDHWDFFTSIPGLSPPEAADAFELLAARIRTVSKERS